MNVRALTRHAFPHRAAAAVAGLALVCLCAQAAEPTHLVLQSGRSLPLAAVVLQGEKFLVKTAGEGFEANSTIALSSVDHVYGEKPPGINQAIALLLTGKTEEARKLLDPILAEHKDSAKIPGNFWLEAARAALVANALEGAAAACGTLGKDISDATPAQGIDPYVTLGKALMLSFTAKTSERVAALQELTTDNMPADLCAYASFFRAELLKKDKNVPLALEAYLTVPCQFPSGGLVINGVAQFKAAEILNAKDHREDAVALLNASIRNCKGTAAEALATQLLENIK